MRCYAAFHVVFPEYISTDIEPFFRRIIQCTGRMSWAGGGTVWKFFAAGIVPVAPWENDSGLTAQAGGMGNYIPAECERCGQ